MLVEYWLDFNYPIGLNKRQHCEQMSQQFGYSHVIVGYELKKKKERILQFDLNGIVLVIFFVKEHRSTMILAKKLIIVWKKEISFLMYGTLPLCLFLAHSSWTLIIVVNRFWSDKRYVIQLCETIDKHSNWWFST